MYKIRYNVPVSEFMEKSKEALYAHWDQVANNKDTIKLNPDWEKYQTVQDNDAMINICVEDDGVIVGYSVVFVQPHLHYKDHVFGMVDVIYVAESHRNSKVGLVLIRETEDKCKEAGVSVLTYHTKPNHPAIEKILYRKGYSHMENIIGIKLGG